MNKWIKVVMGTGNWGIRCQAKTTRQSYWHELRDHQKYCQKNDIKTGTHTQVPVPMTARRPPSHRQTIAAWHLYQKWT